jgi:hypothetical protein
MITCTMRSSRAFQARSRSAFEISQEFVLQVNSGGGHVLKSKTPICFYASLVHEASVKNFNMKVAQHKTDTNIVT